jgi:D-beta-D-heptose 7-phosphate kinase/D-beta-D-heptose 1-phosphate adenosyltransferase
MIPPNAQSLIDRFASQSILVVGDLMLDHFVVGVVTRISPEAPVPIVVHDRDEYRLGGAANVAHNLRALGARADVVGLVGDDEAGGRLVADLRAIGVGAAGVRRDPARPTTLKLRVVTTRNQQVARVDYENDCEPAPDVEADLLIAIDRQIEGARAVVLSDYLKGTLTQAVASRAIDAACRRGIPVLVDPKVPHIERYRGATLVTPNHQEAEVVTLMRVRTAWDARDAARAFRARAGCASVLITRGEHGMWLLDGSSGDAAEYDLPAVAREVSDVTGAGDTVVATLALVMAAGGGLLDAARLANHAAGLVVGKFGPATVTPGELIASLEHHE